MRVRYVLTVFTDRLSSSAILDTAAPDASLQKIWNSRCDSSACSGLSPSPETPSARIWASDGLTYLRPCTTVRIAPTSCVDAASLFKYPDSPARKRFTAY